MPPQPTTQKKEDDPGWRSVREGDTFQPLNKEVEVLIVTKDEFIVFLDPKLAVHYWYGGTYPYDKLPADFGKVLIEESKLEAISDELLRKRQKRVFRTLLGESIARLLDERATSNALAILAQAAEYLKARSDELGRIYYLATSFAETIAVLLTVLLLWVIRAPIASLFGSPDAIDIMVGAGMGSLGAFVSILQRSNKLNINSSAGWPVYVVEATVRALTGAVGGVLVAIAIRSHFILNQINGSDRPLLILMLFCVAAGSSERIVPNLMHQVQGVLGKAKGAVPGDKADSSSSDVESTQEEGGSDEDNPTETETGKQKAQASNDVSNGNERTFELVVTVRERLARPDLRPAEPEGEGDAEPDVEPKEEDLAYSEDRRSESGQAGVKDTNEERPAVTSTAPQGPSPGGQSSEP